MRKVISLSALLSGLLASPMLAAVPREQETGDRAAMVAPAVEGGGIEQLQALLEAGPADVGGMRGLHRMIVANVQGQLAELLAEGPAAPANGSLEGRIGDFPNPSAPAEPVIIGEPMGSAGIGQVMMKAAFLGVTTSPVTATLREQLGLTRGFGLVVDFVAKDSPAEGAGLKVHDVMTKLDDQLLVNGPQLAVLVRSKKAGDVVTLTVIHAGKPVELKAKLVEKDVQVMGDADAPAGTIETFPDVFMKPDEWSFVLPAEGGGLAWQQKKVTRGEDGSVTTMVLDADGVITLTKDQAGKTTIVAKDKAGKEIYRGPYNTEEDKKKVPAKIAAKISNMQAPAITVKSAIDGPAPGANVVYARNDEKHSITMYMDANGKTVTVKDAKTGKVIYEGPANTEEDFKKMPEGVAEKVKAMEEKVKAK